MTGQWRMQRAVPTMILAAAALLGLAAGALTPNAGRADSSTDAESGSEPAALLYFAEGAIHDGDTRSASLADPGFRVTDLVRTSTGWALGLRRPNGDRQVLLRSGYEPVAATVRTSASSFDVSPDGDRLAAPYRGTVEVVATDTGDRIDTITAGLETVQTVRYVDDDLVISGLTTAGHGKILLWNADRDRVTALPFSFVSLLDASESGGYAVLDDNISNDPCPRVVRVAPLEEGSVWHPGCPPEVEDYTLGPDGRYLMVSPPEGHTDSVGIVDLRDPGPIDFLVQRLATDAGWQAARTFLVAQRLGPGSDLSQLLECTVGDGCRSIGTPHRRLVIGRVS